MTTLKERNFDGYLMERRNYGCSNASNTSKERSLEEKEIYERYFPKYDCMKCFRNGAEFASVEHYIHCGGIERK